VKISPLGAVLLHACIWTDGQPDITKLMVAFRSFAKAPIKIYHQLLTKFQQNRLKHVVRQFVLRSINIFIIYEVMTNWPSIGRHKSSCIFLRRVIKQTVIITDVHLFWQFFCELQFRRTLLGISSVNFVVTGYHLIIHSAFIKQLRNNGNTMRQCIIYIDLKKTSDLSTRDTLYNNLIELWVSMKLLILTKMWLN
jgi:hypothetical protein